MNTPLPNNPVELTPAARGRVFELIADEGASRDTLFLRMFVQGGGCSGFQYGFTFDETAADDDFVIEYPEMKLVVDAMSLQYLTGASVDYEESAFSSQFVVKNPHATTTCGCGSSFAA